MAEGLMVRRLRAELKSCLEYARHAAEQVAILEKELAEVWRTARATRETLEQRICELQQVLAAREHGVEMEG